MRMIEFIANGNILNAKTDALVNPVNCVGVMGAGLALQFKNQFPNNFHCYREVCKNGFLTTGTVFTYQRKAWAVPRFIVNFPTKSHWRGMTTIHILEAGLRSLVTAIEMREISSIAVPALGCGLGGLDYRDVKPILCKHLTEVLDEGCKVTIYEPHTKFGNVQKS